MRPAVLFQLVEEGDLRGLTAALDVDPSRARLAWVPERDGDAHAPGGTLLHLAVRGGWRPLTELLIDRGAEYDICVAAARGDFERVEELLDEDPALVNDPSSGLSPLGWAGYGQEVAMVPFLVKRGATVGDEICCPCGTGVVEIVQAFLACGADANGLSSGWRARPLHVAASLRYSCDTTDAMRVLLDAGADVNGTAADGRTTALDVARAGLAKCEPDDVRRKRGFERVLDLLAERGGHPADG